MIGFDRRRERVNVFGVAGIHDVGFCTAVRANLGRGGFDAVSVLVGTNDGRPKSRQGLGARLADAGCGAEDEGRLAIEPE